MNIFRSLGAGLLFALALAPSLAPGGARSARAASFSIPNGDVGALKRALKVASSNGQADTISLAAGGSYVLSQVDTVLSGPNGLPPIEPDGGNPLTIRGNRATIARSGASGTPAFRLAFIRRGAVVAVSDLTLLNGSTTDWGGCINNEAALSLERCALLGSASFNGGAAVNFGSLSLASCVVSGNRGRFAGGISNYTRLSISGSTISNNTALYGGGGVGNGYRAVLSVSNSTFSNNRAGGGGAIHNYGASAALFQSTLSGNSSSGLGGGILNEGGGSSAAPLNATLSIRACTLTQNRASQGGGLDNFRSVARATLSLRSSIVSGNTSGTMGAGPDLLNNDIVQSGGFNLIAGNAGLAPLANNGGPTLTHALLPGSHAINTGDLAPGAAFDQRGPGFLRLRGARADIGAFEVQQAQGPSPTPTPSPTSTPAPTPTLGTGQVRNPANGHVYEIVSARLTWDQARTAAAGRFFGAARGHLATITSQSEQNFVAQLRMQSGQVEGWLGGVQPGGSAEPSGGFSWITGEPFLYANWRAGEPNNAPNDLGSEDAILFTIDDSWNDVPQRLPVDHFFVEYDVNAAQRDAPPSSIKVAHSWPLFLPRLAAARGLAGAVITSAHRASETGIEPATPGFVV